jgi:xanthine dehydrogenase accessory factor
MTTTPPHRYLLPVVFEDYLLQTARRWLEAGRPLALATITRIRGSSSQPLGSRMVIAGEEEFVGSVSGGCVERDVTLQAAPVLAGGGPRLLEYAQVEDTELEVGLNCDGTIDVLLEPLTDELLGMLERPAGTTLRTGYRTPDGREVRELEHRLLVQGSAAEQTVDAAEAAAGAPVCRVTESTEGLHVELSEPRLAPPLLLIFGAATVAFPLSSLGRTMGFRVVVADPRGTYARAEHFPDAHQVVCAWPRELPERLGTAADGLGERACVVSLTHETRFEDDLFRTLMTVPPVAYIGCMGKRARHLEREARQAAAGFDLSALPPVHTPVGLDLGGKEPEDIALSIMAEIQALRRGGSGASLSARAAENDRGASRLYHVLEAAPAPPGRQGAVPRRGSGGDGPEAPRG